MARYRKRPVIIRAVQFLGTAESQKAIEALAMDKGTRALTFESDKLMVETLEGTMTANLRDWIIRGVRGEVYPCKPDIFAATYEPVIEGSFHG